MYREKEYTDVRVYRPRVKNEYVRYRISANERKELIKLSDSAFILFEHYLRVAAFETYPERFLDKKVVETLGWSLDKTKRIRNKIEDNGYVLFSWAQDPLTGRHVQFVYLGKEDVLTARSYGTKKKKPSSAPVESL